MDWRVAEALSLSFSLSVCSSLCPSMSPIISPLRTTTTSLDGRFWLRWSTDDLSPSNVSIAIYLPIHDSVYLAVFLFIHLSTCPSLNIFLLLHLSIQLSMFVTSMLTNSLQASHTCHRFRNCYKIHTRLAHFCGSAESTARAASTSTSGPNVVCFSHFGFEMCFAHLRATTACLFSTSQPPKVVRDRQFLTSFTSKHPSRHNGVHVFNICTCKSAPNMVRLAHFYFETRFASQQRALFTRLWGALNFLSSKSPSRHNGAQFLISHLPRWLRTCALASLLVDPPWGTKHWESAVLCDFSTFSRACIFLSSVTLSLLWFSFFFISVLWLFPPLLLHLPILSEVWLPSAIAIWCPMNGNYWWAIGEPRHPHRLSMPGPSTTKCPWKSPRPAVGAPWLSINRMKVG